MLALEFAWNTQKNGMSALKGLEKEQEREGKISNKEIDPEKTCLNYDLVQSELNLSQRVKKRVEEVRPVSRVQKNSVVDYSNIITVPQEQSKEWGVEKSKEYLKEVYNYFCKEFGKENVVSAKVHLDETAPHMHLHFVPVSEQGKLQARKVMIPQRINKIHSEAPQYLQGKGFDVVRGLGKTDKSLEINEYKRQKAKELSKELDKTVDNLKSGLEALRGVSSTIYELEHLGVKRSLLGSKITLSEKDFNKVMDTAKKGLINSKDFDDIKRENKWLKNNNDSFREVNDKNKDIASKFKKENTKLRKDLDGLKEQAEAMFKIIEKHALIPEAQEYFRTMKNAEKVAEKVLKKSPSKGFDMER